VTAILLVTVLFGNFAEAVAEARGRGQAASLRRARKDLVGAARGRPPRLAERGAGPGRRAAPGDLVIVSAGELIPADGEIVRAWPPSTNPRSPANPRRCCARPAPTAAA
jgi:K+-transporting ATPase ATPase B chain